MANATKKVVITHVTEPCSCRHEFQDQQYGKGIRLKIKCHYPNMGSGSDEIRCTVCLPNRLMKFPSDEIFKTLHSACLMPSIRAMVDKDEEGHVRVKVGA